MRMNVTLEGWTMLSITCTQRKTTKQEMERDEKHTTRPHKENRNHGVMVSLIASHLNPTIGHSLQMLHLAWCFAVSAAATRCRTGNHTMDWGSKCIQSINSFTLISGLLLFWGRDREWRTALEGSCSKCCYCKSAQEKSHVTLIQWRHK